MLVYTAQDEPISPLSCPVHASTFRPADPELLVPDTPRTHTVPLPGPPPTATTATSLEDRMFPLNVLQDLPASQKTTLRSIFLTTPVHVHTPVAHIGIIYGDFPGEKVNMIELIHCLRATYRQMNEPTTMRGEMLFTQRIALDGGATEYQNTSTSGQRSEDIPDGPLLGNDEIWGFEQVSFGGYSVVHLAEQS